MFIGMEATTKLNSMQMFMLKIFDRQLNSKQEQEIKQLLAEYFAKQIDEEMDEIVATRGLTQKDLNKALNTLKRGIL
jgi:hypothetical protein